MKMDMDTDKTLIVLHETVLQSWLRDLGSTVALLGAAWIGVETGLPAASWAAAIVWFLWLAARGKQARNHNRMTPDQAAAYLLRRFGVAAVRRG
jgi:hypothetical protein